MATPTKKNEKCCPQCGEPCAPDALVCRKCRTILTPHSPRPTTPGWLIALYILIIIGLLIYIGNLGQAIFIHHQY